MPNSTLQRWKMLSLKTLCLTTIFSVIVAINLVYSEEPGERERKWENEIARIEKGLKENPPPEGGIFFAGSSSIRLWNLKKSFPDDTYWNVGFGGSEIRDSTLFVNRLIKPYKPKTIIFYAGDNDVANGRKPEQLLHDFAEFTESIHTLLPRTKIVFISIKPSIKRESLIEKQMKANLLIRQYCEQDKRLAFVDISSLMYSDDGKLIPSLFVKDGLHLSPEGYELWSKAIAPHLK